MREFSSSIREGLFNGLVPKNAADGSMYLSDCYNLLGYRTYFGSYKPVQDKLEITKDYPFPQWLRLRHFELIVTRNDVKFLLDNNTLEDISKGDWDSDDFLSPFQGISYGDRFVLINKELCIYYDGSELHKDYELRANAFIEHRDRSVIGGAPNGLWTPEWKDFFADFASSDIVSDFDVKPNSIFWSSFGSVDFPLAFLDLDMVVGDETYFTDLLRHNEWGFLELTFKGAVLDIVEFRGNLVVGGEDGISFVSLDPELPGAGYGEREIIRTGLKSRGSMISDGTELLFIDNDNHLWNFTQDTRNVYDYSEYFKELTGVMSIQRDPNEGLYYIGDGTQSFVFNGQGLFRVSQTVHSLYVSEKDKRGITFSTGYDVALIESDAHDIYNHAQKTLVGVAVIADAPVEGTIEASSEVKGNYYQSPKFPINHEGYSAVRLFGREHKIRVFFNSYKNKNIRAIELKWQSDDTRYRRGISGLENAGTAGSGELE